MPAIQPIPVNAPSPSAEEAARLLANHNRSTDGRQRTPARWNPPTQRGTASGESAGRRVK
jgi:hypothetical protein